MIVLKAKNVFGVGSLLVIVVIVSAFVAHYKTQNDAAVSYINIILQHMNTEMDLLEHWQKSLNSDKYFEERIKYLVISKLILLSTIKPDIDKLRWESIEALNRAIDFNQHHSLSIKEDDPVLNGVDVYLKTIESDVDRRIKRKEELFKNIQKQNKG